MGVTFLRNSGGWQLSAHRKGMSYIAEWQKEFWEYSAYGRKPHSLGCLWRSSQISYCFFISLLLSISLNVTWYETDQDSWLVTKPCPWWQVSNKSIVIWDHGCWDILYCSVETQSRLGRNIQRNKGVARPRLLLLFVFYSPKTTFKMVKSSEADQAKNNKQNFLELYTKWTN